MIYDLNINGFMGEDELKQIAVWAKNVPDNGVIVEFGSLYGRSSVCWALNAKPSTKIYCIDRFSHNEEDTYDIFIQNTCKYKNIIPIRGESPNGIVYDGTLIDILFIDADHTNPQLSNNFLYYKKFMKEKSIMCGHDYCDAWPDVKKMVNLFAKLWKAELVLYEGTTLWELKF